MAKIEQDDLQEMYRLYVDEGVSLDELAAEFGYRRVEISKAFREMTGGEVLRGKASVVEKFDESTLEAIVADYKLGLRIKEIVAKYNIPTTGTFYSLLNQLGVPVRSQTQSVLEARRRAINEAVQMYKDGYAYWQIRDDTGIHQPELCAELHRRGVPMRYAKRTARSS